MRPPAGTATAPGSSSSSARPTSSSPSRRTRGPRPTSPAGSAEGRPTPGQAALRPSPRSPRIGRDSPTGDAEGGPFGMADWRSAIDEFLDENGGLLRSVRRYLHAHPEPSREEFRTAEFLAQHLESAGISPRSLAGG